MSVFMLDTDSVSSSGSSLSSLASQIDSISNSVSGYDTSCDDFDFTSVSACGIKVQNTASVIENVVSSHTTLQNSLKFGAAAAREEEKNNSSSTSSTRSVGTTRSTSNGSTSSNYVSGGYATNYSASSSPYSSSSSEPYSSASSDPGSSATAEPYTSASEDPNTNPSSEPTTGANTKPISELAPQLSGVVVESTFKNASYSPIEGTDSSTGLSAAISHIMNNRDFQYSELGFATIGGMYVISCGKSFGAVGEKLELTLNDGTKIECIIGENIEDEDIHFFVKDDFDEEENALPEDFIETITEVKNFGDSNYYVYGEKVKSAIDWALETAEDDSHGYSQQSRWGDPSYDSSSFVISSFEAAGIPVKDAGAGDSGNMKSAFTENGFVWIPGDPKMEDLQPGDILLNEGEHTEIYIGYGLMVGAHDNFDNTDADSSGNEISVCSYKSYPWNGILRYVGDNEDEGDETYV